MSPETKEHWEQVYRTKSPDEVSWFQSVPELSLELVRATGEPLSAPLVDVGGGTSTLVDHLLKAGYEDLTVLDISGAALELSRVRLGELALRVEWIESDVLAFRPTRRYSIWHDRAVFHFLTDQADRSRYLEALAEGLQPRGHLLLATFGPHGPERCSGLDVLRYSVDDLQRLLGGSFVLRSAKLEVHRTPTRKDQEFLHCWWQARG